MIKRLLKKYGYPPDQRKIATDLVLDQAKLFAEDWSVSNYAQESNNMLAIAEKRNKYK